MSALPELEPTPQPAQDEGPGTGAYDRFVDEMEELGLFADLEEELPPGFSAVYEIARIVADPRSRVNQALAPALRLAEGLLVEQAPPDTGGPEGMIEVPASEEYEAEFIRSWSDVRSIYSWQWLLPEEVLLRRLAERTLWFPMAKAPRIRAVDAGGDEFAPSPTKQKVYLLLDTSASMALRHRFAYAKAIVLHFVRRNRREMGEIFYRTFDQDVGPLHSARDRAGYQRLLRRISRQHTLGNGTCLEKAVLTAVRDIRAQRALAGAEILLVTDGAAHIDEGRVAAALGRDIELHCVKLGTSEVYATDAYVDEYLDHWRGSATRREQRILQVRERREKLLEALRTVHDEGTRHGIRAALREADAERVALGDELRADYAHEIERLARVYVQVPDLGPETLRLDAARLASLEALVRSVLAEATARPAPPHSLKHAALLLSHLATLAAEQDDAAARDRVEELYRMLESGLEESLRHYEEHALETGLLSPAHQRDLRILLRRGSPGHSALWGLLLRLLRRAFARVRRRRGPG